MCNCNNLQVKIKKLDPNATIPRYAKYGDAGMDVVATNMRETEDFVEYGSGLAFEIPFGYVGLLFPRSSNSKKSLLLCNSVGVVDSGYRGEVLFRFKRTGEDRIAGVDGVTNKIYNVGDAVGQIVILPFPSIEFVEADELAPSDRGEGGFGHTGN